MSRCDFLLFGYGRDGEQYHAEYDGSGKLEYTHELSPCASGMEGDSQPCYMSLMVTERYIVTPYQLDADGKIYLLATEKGQLPDDIAARLRKLDARNQ